VSDGEPAPSPKRGRSPQFLAHVYCGQTAGWIKMVLGMEVGLRPGDFVLDRDPSPSPKRERSSPPQFSAHFYCGQTVGCIKMPLALQTARCIKMQLGIEVGLSPWDVVLDGDPAHLPQKGTEPPIFGPCLLRPNGCMDQDAAWYRVRPRPRRHCIRWAPSFPSPKRGRSPSPIFYPYLLWPNGWMDQDDTWHGGGHWSRPHCARWGPSSPTQKRGQRSPPNFLPTFIVAKRLDAPRCHLVWR